MKKLKLNTITTALLLSLSAVPHAIAEEQSNDKSAENIETIEVTGKYIQGYKPHAASGASRLELAITDIPQSISVITSSQINDFRLTDVNTVLDTATGINVERIETDRTYYTARGFDVTNFQIDGIGLPLTSGNNHAGEDTAVYDRVEVIRGANGLMTGVGNPSATVNFIRKRPSVENELTLSGTYGSFGKARAEVDGTIQFNDTFSMRGVAVKETTDSYIDRYGKDKDVFYVFLNANLSDDTQLSLSHSYNDSDATGNLWGALPLYYTDGSATNYDRSTSTAADWSNWQVTTENTVFELNHNINDDWKIRATYSHKETEEDSDLFYVYGTPDKDTELGLTGYASEYILDDEHNLYDIYLNGDFELFGRDHQVILGLNYAKMSYTDRSLYDAENGFPAMPDLNTWDGDAPTPTFDDWETGSDVTQRQKAAYFTGRFNIIDGLHLMVGGRFNQWEVEGTSYSVEQTADENEFIPYIGVVYKVIPEISIYTSYTETFQSQTELDINNKILDPVIGESTEFGVKGELFEGRLITSLAYFDINQENLATLDPATQDLAPTEYRYIGSEGITSHGFEFELAGEIFPGLSASAGFTDFTINGDEQVARYTPSKLFKFAANYEVTQVEGLHVGLNLRWQDDISRLQCDSSTSTCPNGEDIVTEQESYAIIDLMAKYEITEDVSVSFNANNITNEKYLTSLYWAQGYYGAPDNYSATLTWKM